MTAEKAMRGSKVSCVCRWCGTRFLYAAAGVARGRGQFCSRQCSSSCGRHARWSAAKENVAERYERHVVRNGDASCWAWTGFKHNGYGRIKTDNGRAAIGAHRVSYEKHIGPIPEGQCVLHRCDNRECTNPQHLFLGDVAANNRDRDSKGRQAKGERNGVARLTDERVIELREVAKVSPTAATLLGKHWGISNSGVRSVISRRAWRHLP